MRVPLTWLREYAKVPEGASAEDVMADLVRVGLEEEDVHRPSDELYGPIVVGQVLSVEAEEASNGKTINWCQVQVAPEGMTAADGGDAVHGIVCGAHNFSAGDKVVVTLPGSVLPGDFKIAARKTYGHVSEGMIASVRELGIGDDHDGILVLGTLGLDPDVGSDALKLLGLDDEAAELNVTPDRGYCFSIRGVAREYSHATSTGFTDPAGAVSAPPVAGSGFEVRIEDNAPIHGRTGCDRFVARVVRGIDASAPTPPWMSARLRLAGMRSISLVVDVTNYVMLELGQPLHGYDVDQLSGAITVRRAAPGEKLKTLDDKERQLDPEDLLITDDAGILGIAGVMGGERGEASPSTSNVLIEAAHFEEVGIARSARRHRLPSEASKRFERGVDWQIAPVAAERAVQLLTKFGGGTADEAVTDVGKSPQPVSIFLPSDYATSRIGIDFSDKQTTSTLTMLGAEVQPADGGWNVTPPSWRPDLSEKADLSEEIARLVGYDKIPSRLPVAPPGRGLTRSQQQRRRVVQALADSGLAEVLSYPFVSAEANQLFGSAEEAADLQAIRLANPISSEEPFLRRSLLPGLLEVLKRNVGRGFRNTALYESGLVFLPDGQYGSASIPPLGQKPPQQEIESLLEGIPDQPRRIATVMTGTDSPEGAGHSPRSWDWADPLDTADLVGSVLGVTILRRQGKHQAFHPGRTAELHLPSGIVAGYAGELHPKVLAELDAPARTVALELDLDVLFAAAAELIVAKPISTFPVATQDVALVVDADVPATDVLAVLREGAGDLLEDAALFDIYSGSGIAEGKKSLAFGLRFRAPDRTLTSEEASAARSAAVNLAAERLGAVQRA
ncbi:phenylalanine--tRNA ligase subunit beta [Arthrobacter pigmenti]